MEAGMRFRAGLAAATLAVAVSISPMAISPVAAGTPATGHWARVGPASPPLIARSKLDIVEGVKRGPDGRLYVYGGFRDAGGRATADYLAVYDPATGHVAGLGSNGAGNGALDNWVNDITWLDGVLYAVGGFTNAGGVAGASSLAAWNGATWSKVGDFGGSWLYSVAARDGHLYVGGSFANANADPTQDYVAVWDGLGWHGIVPADATDGSITATVDCVVPQADGILYIGGEFINAGGNPAADYAAWWDGGSESWEAIDHSISKAAITGPVVSMAVSGPRVVLGGVFVNANGDKYADRVIEWTGTAWKHYGTNAAHTNGAVPGMVNRVALYGSNVLIAGDFHAVAGKAGTDTVAAWNGAKWLPLLKRPAEQTSVGLNVIGRVLYLAGADPNTAGISRAAGIAAYGLPAPPSAPRSLAGTAGTRKVTLTWKAPTTTNGAALRDYVVQFRRKGTTTWKTFADGVKATTGAVVTGLTGGVTYEFRIRAKNDWGVGAATAVVAKKAK
jgi:hypothetical protein